MISLTTALVFKGRLIITKEDRCCKHCHHKATPVGQ